MTIQEIRELANIKFPPIENFEEAQKYVEEHKVNNRFAIVTGPAGSGKFYKYSAKADATLHIDGFDRGEVEDLITTFGFNKDGKAEFKESDLIKCAKAGGTVVIDYDYFHLVKDEVIQFFINLTSKTEDTEEFRFSEVSPDFKIIMTVTPCYY